MKKCKECNGSGHTGAGRLGFILCSVCHGYGKVSDERAKKFKELSRTHSGWERWK